MFQQNLLSSFIRKIRRAMKRICMLILGLRIYIYDIDVNENITKQYDLTSITTFQLVFHVFWYISSLFSAKQ